MLDSLSGHTLWTTYGGLDFRPASSRGKELTYHLLPDYRVLHDPECSVLLRVTEEGLEDLV